MTDLVGRTPLVWLSRITTARVAGKLESFNPGGSIKDRIGLSMIEDAEKRRCRPGMTIIEPTSGNTGIALAWIAAIKSYRLILKMPEAMTPERRMLLNALGATVILTEDISGMSGAIAKARNLPENSGMLLYPCSSKTARTPTFTAAPLPGKYGMIPMVQWTSLLPVSAPAAR